jgi:uncharacterized protein YoxC
MTITLTMSDFLLMILTLVACVIAYTLVRAVKDIHHAVAQLTRTLESLQGLTSRLQGVSEEAERTLVSVRRFTDEGYAVAGDLSATSAQVRAVVEEGAESVRVLFTPLRYVSLLIAGLRAGFEAYSRIRLRNAEAPTDDDD